MTASRTPVVFIHGLWLHATSWDPWLERFAAAGYAPSAPPWPGEPPTVEEARADPERLAGVGIDDVVDAYAAGMDGEAPILIGHSFGGMIVEKLLGQGHGRAGIAIDAAPIKGVLPTPISALRSAFPVLRNPANRNRAVSLTPDQFHYAFGNAVTREESDALHERWSIPAPGRPLFQAATANVTPHSEAAVDTRNEDRGPLLLIAGGEDHTVPEAVTESTLKQYRHSSAETDLIAMDDRGHSLVVDSGWPEVADVCLTWLRERGL
ncbi:MAG TPA: alpha/beta hydrolase [Miltoncostaea sp.]|nr:alpha/beta hydrolase [Miltoncostaea sp.]